MITSEGICKVAYGIGYLPGRKRVALYRTCGALTSAIAWFDDEAEALEFMQFVDTMTLRTEPRADTAFHGWAIVTR